MGFEGDIVLGWRVRQSGFTGFYNITSIPFVQAFIGLNVTLTTSPGSMAYGATVNIARTSIPSSLQLTDLRELCWKMDLLNRPVEL